MHIPLDYCCYNYDSNTTTYLMYNDCKYPYYINNSIKKKKKYKIVHKSF